MRFIQFRRFGFIQLTQSGKGVNGGTVYFFLRHSCLIISSFFKFFFNGSINRWNHVCLELIFFMAQGQLTGPGSASRARLFSPAARRRDREVIISIFSNRNSH